MFIVQYNLMNEKSLGMLSSALADYRIPHKFVGVIPFSREITSDEPLVGQNFIPYGSTLLTTLTGHTEDGLHWRGNYFDHITFNAGIWNSCRDDMLNAGKCVMPLSDAIEFLKRQDAKSDWFVRPSEDLKQFSGMVTEAGECIKFFTDAMECESSGTYKLAPETLVVVSEPKNIQAEWRWFIVDGQVISGSMYRFKGQMHKAEETDAQTIAEAQYFADKWLPHRNCVMDLALVDGQVKVLEFNTINSSGFYDHNVEKIVTALWFDFLKGGKYDRS